MKNEKDQLILQLIHFIESESQYLTRDDQENIIRKVWELNEYINNTYKERHDQVFSLK